MHKPYIIIVAVCTRASEGNGQFRCIQKRGALLVVFILKVDRVLRESFPKETMSPLTREPEGNWNEEFMRLFTQNSRQIYAYICSLLPLLEEVDDVYQETSMVLWQNFDRYEPGTNFGAWATRVAYFQVMAYRKRKSSSKLEFSNEFVETVALDASEGMVQREKERCLLQNCLGKLRPKDSQLIRHRYELGHSIKALAEQIGRPVGGVYKSLARIENALLDCVRDAQVRLGLNDK